MIQCLKRRALPLIVMAAVGLSALPAYATSVRQANIADLIGTSDVIKVGTIVSVTDGLDANNVPYTEVTLDVSETLLGEAGPTYTFRQFGLIEPRQMPDGRVNLNVSPDGWARYAPGEKVVLFLYRAASLTGLRTTVGLFQGKFDINGTQVANQINNQGLFRDVTIDPTVLSAKQQQIVSRSGGAISEDAFLDLVRRAVDEGWIQSGRMINANQ